MAMEYGSSPAGGRGTGPDGDPPVFRQLRQPLGKDLEMVRLAEEGGHVGGECVDERLHLLRVALLEKFQVIGEAVEPSGAQTARQTAVDHVPFAGRQRNPGALVDKRPDPGEVILGERVVIRCSASRRFFEVRHLSLASVKHKAPF